MKIGERRAHDYTILDLAERLTIKEDLEMLERRVKDILARGEQKIALNLKEISYLDSTGSAMLIVCYNTARRSGVDLKFLNPSRHVSKIFEVTKLDTIFDIRTEEQLGPVQQQA